MSVVKDVDFKEMPSSIFVNDDDDDDINMLKIFKTHKFEILYFSTRKILCVMKKTVANISRIISISTYLSPIYLLPISHRLLMRTSGNKTYNI